MPLAFVRLGQHSGSFVFGAEPRREVPSEVLAQLGARKRGRERSGGQCEAGGKRGCVGMSRSQRDDEAKAGADDVEARAAALSKHHFQ